MSKRTQLHSFGSIPETTRTLGSFSLFLHFFFITCQGEILCKWFWRENWCYFIFFISIIIFSFFLGARVSGKSQIFPFFKLQVTVSSSLQNFQVLLGVEDCYPVQTTHENSVLVVPCVRVSKRVWIDEIPSQIDNTKEGFYY